MKEKNVTNKEDEEDEQVKKGQRYAEIRVGGITEGNI